MPREKLTRNFSRVEMQCGCCFRCDMRPEFMEALQAVRTELDKPMKVTSGFRCTKHNAKVRGAPDSQHTYGNAVDIACESMFDRYEIVRLALKHGFTGIEVSPKHIHLDMRTTTPRLMWTDFRTIA